jgi:hypothetical protein
MIIIIIIIIIIIRYCNLQVTRPHCCQVNKYI